MAQKQFLDFECPREKALHGMQASIDSDQWERNSNFVNSIKHLISQHPVSSHPAIDILKSGVLSHETLKKIHLEYRHAIVQIFTDALLMAQVQTRQLEPRLAPGSKMFPRFLLSLNILDEFGFRPGANIEGYYLGNPEYAHYPLFEDIVSEFGVSIEERNQYKPSEEAIAVRNYLEDSYGDYKLISALLAVAEEEVILYSPPLREATKRIGFDVDCGYYYVHGVSDDETADAADDDHEEDLWLILTQACITADYNAIKASCSTYCDLWAAFWDKQMEIAQSDLRAA